MNAGQEATARMYRDIYQTVLDVLDELGYDGWGTLDTHELLKEVMTRTSGHYNPQTITRIIQEL